MRGASLARVASPEMTGLSKALPIAPDHRPISRLSVDGVNSRPGCAARESCTKGSRSFLPRVHRPSVFWPGGAAPGAPDAGRPETGPSARGSVAGAGSVAVAGAGSVAVAGSVSAGAGSVAVVVGSVSAGVAGAVVALRVRRLVVGMVNYLQQ